MIYQQVRRIHFLLVIFALFAAMEGMVGFCIVLNRIYVHDK